jgi:hypothetical protein
LGSLDPVELEEDGRRQPTKPLVAVHEGVVVDDRLEQRCGFGVRRKVVGPFSVLFEGD